MAIKTGQGVGFILSLLVTQSFIVGVTIAAESAYTLAYSNQNGLSNYSSPSLTVTSDEQFPFTVDVGKESTIAFNFTVNDGIHDNRTNLPEYIIDSSAIVSYEIKVAIKDENLVHLTSPRQVKLNSESGSFEVKLAGSLPGRTVLEFQLHILTLSNVSTSSSDVRVVSAVRVITQPDVLALAIEKPETILDQMFTVVIVLLVTFANIGLGCTVDLDVVKVNLKKPLAPAIGMFSQFVFMPLIAYTCVRSIGFEPGVGLGLFAMGCSPGGSTSNAFCHLLGGDVSLSITMTFISTVAALGFIPLWLFTLGADIAAGTDIQIPFTIILTSLIGIVLPVAIGIFIQRKFPRVAKFLVASIKYVMGVAILFLLTAGVYINLYMFHLMTVEVLLGSALLPYVGFLLGGILALVLKRDRGIISTIAIETGIQNSGVAVMLLRLSLTGPERNTAIVPPVASSILTPIPLALVTVFLQFRNWRRKNRAQNNDDAESKSKKINDGDDFNVLYDSFEIDKQDDDQIDSFVQSVSNYNTRF